MKFEVNVSKTKFFFLLGTILLFTGAIAVYAFSPLGSFFKTKAQAQNLGHSADEIVIRASDGNDYTLQEAILLGKLGGGGTGSTPDFDSGWRTINQGQTLDITHNLGTLETSVYLEVNSSSLRINHFSYGGEDTGEHKVGFYWKEKDSNTIKVIRDVDSFHASSIRVLMWKLNRAPLTVSCSPNKATVNRYPGPPALPSSTYQIVWSAVVSGADPNPSYTTYNWVDERGILDSQHGNPITRTYGSTGTVSYTLTVISAGRTATANCGSATVV